MTDYTLINIKKETLAKINEICSASASECIDEFVNALYKINDSLKKLVNSKEGKKLVGYAGGDWFIKDELISIAMQVPLIRATFVEVFGGSGVLSQYIPRSKFTNIIYNDIDKDLVSLHEYVKNNPDLLASILYILPYSRYVREQIYKNHAGRDIGGLIGAVAMFYLLRSGYFGTFREGFGVHIKPNSSTAVRYMSGIASIYSTAERFRDVVIECADFEYIIKKYDSNGTLFYLDPPFVSSDKTKRDDFYRYTFTEADAVRLTRILRNIKGYFMLKISEDNEKYYSSIAVDRAEIVTKKSMKLVRDGERRDVKIIVLTNYKLNRKSNINLLEMQNAR
ncbi:MAG: DNA adenine methylase [Desulfurococcaceae archaeon]